MRKHSRSLAGALVLSLAVVVVGCESSGPEESELDAGGGDDGGAGGSDAGLASDAGSDAGPPDAGPTPCESDADCVDAPHGFVCDIHALTCRGCGRDLECEGSADGATCNEATGRCQECRSDADCESSPAGPMCNVEAGTCYGCDSDADCLGHPNGPMCNTSGGAGWRGCWRCTGPADCWDNFWCSPQGACFSLLDRCESAATCGGLGCDEICVRCRQDSHCVGSPFGETCNTSTGACE